MAGKGKGALPCLSPLHAWPARVLTSGHAIAAGQGVAVVRDGFHLVLTTTFPAEDVSEYLVHVPLHDCKVALFDPQHDP